MRGNSHVRFWNGGGAVARPTDRNHPTGFASLRSARLRVMRVPLGTNARTQNQGH